RAHASPSRADRCGFRTEIGGGRRDMSAPSRSARRRVDRRAAARRQRHAVLRWFEPSRSMLCSDFATDSLGIPAGITDVRLTSIFSGGAGSSALLAATPAKPNRFQDVISRIAAHPTALARNIDAIFQSPRFSIAYAIADVCEARNKAQVPDEMARAPLVSLIAVAICGRYARNRRLLNSVNTASVTSAAVIGAPAIGPDPRD